MAEATFWHQASPGTTYVRCELPARHLPGSLRFVEDIQIAEPDPGEFEFPNQDGDTAIWQFPGSNAWAVLMAQMQENGIRCLVEVDDNYFKVAPFMQAWQTGLQRVADTRHSLAIHREIVGWADGVICSTPRLADVYSDVNENVYVCRNAVDPDDWPELSPREGPLRIGWAGSDSHAVDAPLVRRAMEWAVRQPNVEVHLIGYQPPWRGPFKRTRWTDTLAEYRASLARLRLDVGICPLLSSDWSNGKSDVKALEYVMAGAMPIVSRAEPYREWWDRTLSVPQKVKEWEQALKWCVAHPDDVRRQALRAREYVLGERTIAREVGAWRQAVGLAVRA